MGVVCVEYVYMCVVVALCVSIVGVMVFVLLFWGCVGNVCTIHYGVVIVLCICAVC